jgi:hypothetical protein
MNMSGIALRCEPGCHGFGHFDCSARWRSLRFDCSARWRSLRADRALKPLSSSLARGQHDCELMAVAEAGRSLVRPDSGARDPV